MAERFLEIQCDKSGEFTLKVRPQKLKVLPGETLGHMRQANKELLLAMRGALDWAIQRMETPKEGGTKRHHIEVQEEEA